MSKPVGHEVAQLIEGQGPRRRSMWNDAPVVDGEAQSSLPVDLALLGLLKGWAVDPGCLDGDDAEMAFVADVLHRLPNVSLDDNLPSAQDPADVGALLIALARLDDVDLTLWSRVRTWADSAAQVMCQQPDVRLATLHDQVRVQLLELGYRAGVWKDDRVVELLFSGFGRLGYRVAHESLIRVTEYCESRATDRAAIRWFTLTVALLDSMADDGEYESQDDFSLYGVNVLNAISKCAEMMSGYKEPVPPECLAWVSTHVLDFLRRTERRCHSDLPVDDSWLGAVLYICDTLVLEGRIDDVIAILDRCEEVGDAVRRTSRNTRELDPSRFRDDLPFLRALVVRGNRS